MGVAELGTYFCSYWVQARSQLGARYIGKQLKTLRLAENEVLPRLTKNTASGFCGGQTIFLTVC